MRGHRSKFIVQKASLNHISGQVAETKRKLALLETIYSEAERNIRTFGNQVLSMQVQHSTGVLSVDDVASVVGEVQRLLQALEVYRAGLGRASESTSHPETSLQLFSDLLSLKAVKFVPALKLEHKGDVVLGSLEEYSINGIAKKEILDVRTRSDSYNNYRSFSDNESSLDIPTLNAGFDEYPPIVRLDLAGASSDNQSEAASTSCFPESISEFQDLRCDETASTPKYYANGYNTQTLQKLNKEGAYRPLYSSNQHSTPTIQYAGDRNSTAALQYTRSHHKVPSQLDSNGIPTSAWATSQLSRCTLLWHNSTEGLPEGLCFVGESQLVIADSHEHRLNIYTEKHGEIYQTIHQDKIEQILGDWHFQPQCVANITLNRRHTFAVTDAQDHCIKFFDCFSGRHLRNIRLDPKLAAPYGLTMLDESTIAVTHCNDLISLHDLGGKTVKVIKGQGNFWYISTDSAGRMVVSDCYNHCVKVYSREGVLRLSFGSKGHSDGQLNYPHGVCVDSNDCFLVADGCNNRICKFSPDGKFLQTVLSASDGLKWPRGVAVSTEGHVAVTWGKCVSLWKTNTCHASSTALFTYL